MLYVQLDNVSLVKKLQNVGDCSALIESSLRRICYDVAPIVMWFCHIVNFEFRHMLVAYMAFEL